tara:strand:- start:162 stop:455 length:294 start_codon:yes stop_codon:yes gene_type:complete
MNTINIYGVDEIIEIGKMFEEKGMKLGSVFIKETDLKMTKKVLDIHASDMNKGSNTVVFVSIDNDEIFHRMWFKLVSWKTTNFDSWKLISESKEYKQ